jgi:hypothetical protein
VAFQAAFEGPPSHEFADVYGEDETADAYDEDEDDASRAVRRLRAEEEEEQEEEQGEEEERASRAYAPQRQLRRVNDSRVKTARMMEFERRQLDAHQMVRTPRHMQHGGALHVESSLPMTHNLQPFKPITYDLSSENPVSKSAFQIQLCTATARGMLKGTSGHPHRAGWGAQLELN